MFINRQRDSRDCRVIMITDKPVTGMYLKCHLKGLPFTFFKISLHSQQVLLTLTTVGCSLSIACLAMTLIAFAYLRYVSSNPLDF